MDTTKKRTIKDVQAILDKLDSKLIFALQWRQDRSAELGALKGHKQIVDAEEFERRRELYREGLGEFGAELYTLIHADSVRIQKK